MHILSTRRLLLVVAAFLVASGTLAGAATSSKSVTPQLKVALIAPSAHNDLAFTQSMYSALKTLQAKYGFKFSVSENQFVVADAANIMRQYAAQGYNLIIAHGSQYGGTVQQLAPKYPKVAFAWGTASSTFGLPNVYAYQAASNQGGYVQANPDTAVHVSYTGTFSDPSLMSKQATQYLAQKADVLTGSSQSVVGAITVAKQNNIAWFGTQWSQASLAPKQVVSSQIYDWTGVLTGVLNGIQTGKLGGSSYTINLKNGGEKIQFNPGFTLTASAKAAVQKVITGIQNGSIKVPQ